MLKLQSCACRPGFWLFPKGWGSEVLILRLRAGFRPPTTHQILVIRHAEAVRRAMQAGPPTHLRHAHACMKMKIRTVVVHCTVLYSRTVLDLESYHTGVHVCTYVPSKRLQLYCPTDDPIQNDRVPPTHPPCCMQREARPDSAPI